MAICDLDIFHVTFFHCRLRGSYDALDGGLTQDALVDMTGGISEVINIENKREVPDNLYDMLMKSFSMKSMLGACIFVSKHKPIFVMCIKVTME